MWYNTMTSEKGMLRYGRASNLRSEGKCGGYFSDGEPMSCIEQPTERRDEFSSADLLFTLNICRKHLPADADPVHAERLKVIERIVRREFDRSEPER